MKSWAWAARAAAIASSGAGFGPAVDQVVADRAAEQERLLEHDADVPPEVAGGQLADVDAVEQHAAGVDVVEPADQVHERRLAAAAAADDADLLAGLDREVDVLEHRPMPLVAEGDVLEPDLARRPAAVGSGSAGSWVSTGVSSSSKTRWQPVRKLVSQVVNCESVASGA